MFSDDNQQFLKSFGVQDQVSVGAQQLNNYQQTPSLNRTESNQKSSERNNLNSSQRNQSSINEQERQLYSIQQKQPVAQLNSAKTFAILTKSNKFRRFSQQNNIQFVSRLQHHKQQRIQIQISAKSEGSVEIDDGKSNNQDHMEDRSNKSAKQKGYKFDIVEIEGSLMKKIRNLQARIKNIDLNYKTIILKMKNENNKLTKQNSYIKQFLKNKQEYAVVIQAIDKYIQEKEQSDSQDFLDSSDSDKSDDQLMPIMSKIQQIKFDGQKLCEAVKNYQQSFNKKKQQEQQLLKKKLNEQNLQNDGNEQIRKSNLRKYSIPLSGVRSQKKQSFKTTTILTDANSKQAEKQKELNNLQQQIICATCKQQIIRNRKNEASNLID